ncbi:MAG TPA: hypothetical protein VMA72_28820 [Streptosporangiaceae bacterium]|nr:hypothetical protein [Streptosporangiaceae bacterium]
MDEDAIAVILHAERIIYRAGWRLLEETVLDGLARTRGLHRAPLEPRSEVIQLVTYDGEHIGHIRCDRAAAGQTWVAVPQPRGRPVGAYRSAQEAAEALARACGKLSPGIPGHQES